MLLGNVLIVRIPTVSDPCRSTSGHWVALEHHVKETSEFSLDLTF